MKAPKVRILPRHTLMSYLNGSSFIINCRLKVYNFSCLRYLSMVSHPFGCFILIWSVAEERSVRVSGVSFVFPKTSSLRAIADCHSSVMNPRRLRLCMRYASWRLLFDFRTPLSLQAKKSLSILEDMQVVNN